MIDRINSKPIHTPYNINYKGMFWTNSDAV